MKKTSGMFLAIITIIGLVFGGFLLSSPNNTQQEGEVEVDTSLLYYGKSPKYVGKNPTIRIAVFSDYLCPYCKDAHNLIKETIDRYGDNIEIYYRNLIVHENARIFAKAALAANKQGKFKEFDNIFFEREVESSEQAVVDIATELGMNVEQFKSDLNSQETNNILSQDENDSLSLQIKGTPTLFIEDEQLEDFRDLPTVVKSKL